MIILQSKENFINNGFFVNENDQVFAISKDIANEDSFLVSNYQLTTKEVVKLTKLVEDKDPEKKGLFKVEAFKILMQVANSENRISSSLRMSSYEVFELTKTGDENAPDVELTATEENAYIREHNKAMEEAGESFETGFEETEESLYIENMEMIPVDNIKPVIEVCDGNKVDIVKVVPSHVDKPVMKKGVAIDSSVTPVIPTNRAFFDDLDHVFTKGEVINVTIASANGMMTVITKINKEPPITITGTAKDFDTDYIDTIYDAFFSTSEERNNIAEYKEQMKKAAEKPKTVTKKASSKTSVFKAEKFPLGFVVMKDGNIVDEASATKVDVQFNITANMVDTKLQKMSPENITIEIHNAQTEGTRNVIIADREEVSIGTAINARLKFKEIPDPMVYLLSGMTIKKSEADRKQLNYKLTKEVKDVETNSLF